ETELAKRRRWIGALVLIVESTGLDHDPVGAHFDVNPIRFSGAKLLRGILLHAAPYKRLSLDAAALVNRVLQAIAIVDPIDVPFHPLLREHCPEERLLPGAGHFEVVGAILQPAHRGAFVDPPALAVLFPLAGILKRVAFFERWRRNNLPPAAS